MVKKLLFLTFTLTLFVFIACDKDNEGTEPTVGHDPAVVATWDLTAMTLNGNAVNPNNANDVPVQLIFNSDGTGTVKLSDYGGTPSNGSYTWSTSGNQMTITPTGDSPITGPYTVNSTTFSFTYIEGNDTYNLTYTKSASTSGATVSGTMTLPSVANGLTWLVLIDDDFDGGNGYIYVSSGICGSTTTENYTINNVTAGTYYVYAVVCHSAGCPNGPQSGDFIGIYGGTYANPPVSPNVNVPASGTVTFNINLEVMP